MKKLVKLAAVMLLVVAGPRLKAEDAVLYWMVEDPIVWEYDEQGTKLYADQVLSRPDGKTVNGARVRVTTSSGDTYLSMLNDDNSVSALPYVEVTPMVEGHPEWGMTGGPAMSYVAAGYISDPSTMFTMELGHWENDEWLVMAVSASLNWESIKKFTSLSDVGTPGGQHWAPAMYVPEPSSGLLLFIGGALLALRRKHAVVAA